METKDILKMIRKDLGGITQDDLACPHISRTVISRIESGARELDRKKAMRISEKIIQLAKERSITLDYDVTPDFLLGIKRFDSEKIIKNLKIDINRKTLKELDCALSEMVNTDFIELSIKAIEVFKEDFYKNNNLIIMYTLEVLKHSVTPCRAIDLNITLIKAYYTKGEFSSIIHIAEKMIKEIEKLSNKEKQMSFYYNVATAYYKEKQYSEALELIILMKQLKLKKYDAKILTLEANIETKLKNYESAKKILFKIIRISDDSSIIANCYSNIASLYQEIKQYKKAKLYIQKSIEYLDEVSIQCKYNILYNKFDLSIEINESNDVYESFVKLLKVLVKFDNKIEQNKVFRKIVEYYNDKTAVFHAISMIKQHNLEMSSEVKLLVFLKFCKDFEILELFA